MKSSFLPLLVAPMIFSAEAQVIEWTATGTVSSVTGTGFAGMAAPATPVSVKFSYQTGALVDAYGGTVFGSNTNAKTEFYGNIGLTMEVTIGALTWKGSQATSAKGAPYALHTDAWDGPGAPYDDFTILASSADSGVFTPFPYSGASTSRSIQVVLRDDTAPGDFIPIAELPNASAAVNKITSGTGFVSTSTDRINFTLTPASVTVTAVAPPIPVKISRTPTGIELRWPSQIGVNYRLQDCDALTGWQPVGAAYPGTGSEIVVPLDPFTAYPTRRFYRVIPE